MNIIIGSMARALWVCAWADHEEEEDRTYPGQELMDVAPETPILATIEGARLCGKYEEANGLEIHCLAQQAANAEGISLENRSPDFDQEFGHALAMMALRHGVSWFDDHERFPLIAPSAEAIYEELSC